MTQFKIPDAKKIFALDLENLGGNDEYSQVPLATRSPDMKNIINRLGMHQIRENIEQTYIVNPTDISSNTDDDKHCNIKWVGKIEEYDNLGNPIPYYIKISEYLGTKDLVNDSYIYISIWPSPDVKNIQFNMNNLAGYENYRITYKKYTFTNYGKTGNSRGLYEEVEFDGKTYVFTPIGILSFNCNTTENDGIKTLNFDLNNVIDNPYIPTLIISASPDGTAKTVYEAVNILTNKRKVQFLGTQNDTEYYLPEHPIATVNSIKILQSTGQYAELDPSNYTVNTLTGVITFGLAPGESPVSGTDNVIIEYSKNPLEGNETNEFTLSTSTGNNFLASTINITKATNQTDPSKIDIEISYVITTGTSYGNDNDLTDVSLIVKAGNTILPLDPITSTDITNIKEGTFTKTKELTIANDGATDSRNWTATLNATIVTTTTTSTTTGVPGSIGTDINLNAQRFTAASGLYLLTSATAKAHLGTKADGSDSYWDVYVYPRVNVTYSIYKKSVDLYNIIDGVTCGPIGTGYMGTDNGGTWPSSGAIYKKIPYAANKTSITIKTYCNFAPLDWGGTQVGYRETPDYTLNLPSIQLPTLQTITETSTSTSIDSGSNSYSEGIKKAEHFTINYENNAETSARLACYYSTKATAVYGYENDRRIFVTNGNNTDTFSGKPADSNYGTISYFPDINYSVLGEDSNILGYAQKAGYLFTIKEGADSLYVRKGAIIDNDLQFPSIMVRRNVQILCRPIEIDGNIYVITRNGLEEIGFEYVQSYTYELLTYLRSYYISNYFKLGADYKYKQMEWFNESGLLHIYLDNYEFVFDLNSKSYVKEQASSLGTQLTKGLPYQFEAYVCTIPQLNANLYAPKVTVYLPKDFERADYGVVNEDIIPFGYNATGIYKFSYSNYKVDILKEISNNVENSKYYPIKAHYFTPFLDFDTTMQLKTIKQLTINTTGHNGDEYYIGYVVQDGTQLLIDKIVNTANDEQTFLRNGQTPFPKIISIKNKIRKFSNAKLFIKNKADYLNINEIPLGGSVSDYSNMTFNRITLKYVDAGKYRGD